MGLVDDLGQRPRRRPIQIVLIWAVKDAYSVGGVDVNLDNKNTFKGEVNKDHADRPKGKVFAIATGNHSLTVSYNSKVIYKKQIFVSSQETKRIILP